jgi:hypothetical protein
MNARLLPSLAVASLVLGANVAAAQTAAGTEERVTRSAAGPVSDHAADELRDPTTFEVSRRDPSEITVKPRRAPGKGLSTLQAYGDSWVYEATTDAFADRDADGYFRYLRVRFDVDSIYTTMWVYAEIYLSADGESWEHLYSTDDFATCCSRSTTPTRTSSSTSTVRTSRRNSRCCRSRTQVATAWSSSFRPRITAAAERSRGSASPACSVLSRCAAGARLSDAHHSGSRPSPLPLLYTPSTSNSS